MRTSRPKTPVIYGPDEKFPIGGSKVLRQSDTDVATVVAAGVTVFEALKAYDQLKKEGIAIRVIDAYSVQPIDAATLRDAARGDQGRRDHRRGSLRGRRHRRRGQRGGRAGRRRRPAARVREIPRSGQPDELLDRYGISARHIVDDGPAGATRSN